MKYKVGDHVRIKSLDWYNKNKNKNNHVYLMRDDFYGCYFIETMSPFCNKIMTISNIMSNYYYMLEDGGKHYWTDEMIEGLAEEKSDVNKWTGLKVELELSKSIIDVSNVEDLQGERFMSGFVKAIMPPDGYQFVDDSGNVINTTKIVLEKKKGVYPRSLAECLRVLGDTEDALLSNQKNLYSYNINLLVDFQKLLICRDAYWKIAGEEMGLGESWKPDYNEESYEQGSPIKYVIYYTGTHITKERKCTPSYILTFPTEEMRDAFYENFKVLVESCKELYCY